MTGSSFWTPKTIEDIAKEQGAELPQPDIADILGAGAELWDSDEEFEAFLQSLASKRQADREAESRRSAAEHKPARGPEKRQISGKAASAASKVLREARTEKNSKTAVGNSLAYRSSKTSKK